MNTKTILFGLMITGLLFSHSAISETLRIYNFAACQQGTGSNPPLVCPSVNSQFSGIKSSWVGVIDNASTAELCARLNAVSFFGKSVSIRRGAEKCTGIAKKSTRAIFLNTGSLNNIPRDATYYHVVTTKANAEGGKEGLVLEGELEDGDVLVSTYFVSEN